MQTPSTNSGLEHGTSQSEDAGLNTDNSLSTWFKKRIGALHGGSALPSGVSVQEVLQQGKEAGITTSVGRTFEAEFDEVFAPDARIVMNHVEVPLSELRANFAARRTAVVGEKLEWGSVFEGGVGGTGGVQQAAKGKEGKEGIEDIEGIVAGSYVLTRSLKFRIRVTHAQSISSVVFSAKVKNSGTGPGDGVDGRRIVELYLTIVDKAAPVRMYPIPSVRPPSR